MLPKWRTEHGHFFKIEDCLWGQVDCDLKIFEAACEKQNVKIILKSMRNRAKLAWENCKNIRMF